MEQNFEIPYLGPPCKKFIIHGTINLHDSIVLSEDIYCIRIRIYSPSTGDAVDHALDGLISTYATKINMKVWGLPDSIVQISCGSLKESRSIHRTYILINNSSAGTLLNVAKRLIAEHHNLIPIVL